MRLCAAHPTRDRIPCALEHDCDLVHQGRSKQHEHARLWNTDDLAIAKLGFGFVDYERSPIECWQAGGSLAPVKVEQEALLVFGKNRGCDGVSYPAGTSTSTNVRLTEAEIHAVSTACRTPVSSHR